MSNKTIHELDNLSEIAQNDEMLIYDISAGADNPTKKTTVGTIKDFMANNIKDVYSTDEVKTNKVWIDEKPIYRRTINYTTVQTEETMIFPIPNFDKKVNLYGSFMLPTGASFSVPYCFIERNMSFYEIYCYVTNQALQIIPYSSAGTYFVIGCVLQVTIEYTKTTD